MKLAHILFVCTGNTCRSPMAEGLLRQAAAAIPEIHASSAGVAAYPGDSMNPETATILMKRNAEIADFASRPVSDALLADATHVLAMTAGHLDQLKRRFPKHREKFHLVAAFSTTPNEEIPDPIGCGPAAYEATARVLEKLLPDLILHLSRAENASA